MKKKFKIMRTLKKQNHHQQQQNRRRGMNGREFSQNLRERGKSHHPHWDLEMFPSGAARNFSSRVNFQCRLAYGVRTPPCAIACNYSCAQVKDTVVHVRDQWIMETQKHPACTVGWEARL